MRTKILLKPDLQIISQISLLICGRNPIHSYESTTSNTEMSVIAINTTRTYLKCHILLLSFFYK